MPNPAAVLVVEDDVSTRGLLVAVVKRLGLVATTAGDGRTALAIIADHPPAALILDLLLPELDGFEVLRILRRDSPEMLARTIAITAAAIRVAEYPDLDQVWRFFRKPLDIDQFGDSVLACVRQPSKKTGRDGAYETPSRP
jgi:CheY-like chemotaxis protein